MTEPILLIPAFRSGRETPWAGDVLRKEFEKYTLGNLIGESYDFSFIEKLECTTPDGQPLSAVWHACTATPAITPQFVIKWIDASASTSVHLHPEHDEYLYILKAQTDACVITGLDKNISPDIIGSTLLSNDPSCLFSSITPKVSNLIHIPAGVPHALKGVTCWCVQTKCSPTLRLYDWQRTNARGQKRQLQFENALSSISHDTAETTCSPHDQSNHPIICTNAFDVFEISGVENLPYSSVGNFAVITCVSPAEITLCTGKKLYLSAGQSVLLPHNVDSFNFSAAHAFFVYPKE